MLMQRDSATSAPGRTNTGLAPPLTPDEAADTISTFLRDAAMRFLRQTFARARELDLPVVMPSPRDVACAAAPGFRGEVEGGCVRAVAGPTRGRDPQRYRAGQALQTSVQA
jgi:hypothetical protein